MSERNGRNWCFILLYQDDLIISLCWDIKHWINSLFNKSNLILVLEKRSLVLCVLLNMSDVWQRYISVMEIYPVSREMYLKEEEEKSESGSQVCCPCVIFTETVWDGPKWKFDEEKQCCGEKVALDETEMLKIQYCF